MFADSSWAWSNCGIKDEVGGITKRVGALRAHAPPYGIDREAKGLQGHKQLHLYLKARHKDSQTTLQRRSIPSSGKQICILPRDIQIPAWGARGQRTSGTSTPLSIGRRTHAQFESKLSPTSSKATSIPLLSSPFRPSSNPSNSHLHLKLVTSSIRNDLGISNHCALSQFSIRDCRRP